MPRIHVIGALVYDLVFEVPDWVEPNRAVHATQVTLSPGGKALNQAAAARLLGADVSLIGCVGDDLFGAEMLEEMGRIGVNVDYVRVHKTARTSLASIVVKDMLPGFIGAPDASRKISEINIEGALGCLQAEDVLLVDFEIPQALVQHALQIGRDVGAKTVLNPAPFFTRDTFVIGYLHLVDVLIPNMLEAQLIVGDDTADENELACRLLKLGVGQVVMTLGEAGCTLYEKSFKAEQWACSLDVVDTTGASDAFVGAYCLGLLENWPAGQALEFATATAGLACTRRGTMASMPSLTEVQALLKELRM